MWNIQANIYLDEEAKQKDPVIGDLLERVMNKYRIAQNSGGGKLWRIWRIERHSPIFYPVKSIQ